jgi:hypothetical protein
MVLECGSTLIKCFWSNVLFNFNPCLQWYLPACNGIRPRPDSPQLFKPNRKVGGQSFRSTNSGACRGSMHHTSCLLLVAPLVAAVTSQIGSVAAITNTTRPVQYIHSTCATCSRRNATILPIGRRHNPIVQQLLLLSPHWIVVVLYVVVVVGDLVLVDDSNDNGNCCWCSCWGGGYRVLRMGKRDL